VQVNPSHSSKSPGVYHVCSRCTEGNNIEPKNKRSGTGGGRMCQRCKELKGWGVLGAPRHLSRIMP
jgi:hypothetical protein